MDRETWLNSMAEKMAPRFEELGHQLPKFRVSIGFPSSGAASSANGECWADVCTEDKHFTIFISPKEASSMAIAAILNHELIHAAVGLKEGHTGKFAQMMKSTGMVRPFTTSTPGDDFKSWVQPFIDELGEIPHSQLRVRGEGSARLFKKVGAGVDAADKQDAGDGDTEPTSNRPKTQTTRMLKAACLHDVDGSHCGYTIRLSKKWALELGAACPAHGAMEVEGVDDPEE